MDLSKFQDDTIRAEWLLAESEQGEQVDIPMQIGAWGRANEIRADIFLSDSADGQIYCTHRVGASNPKA